GIRDGHVTGVQTCALPILTGKATATRDRGIAKAAPAASSTIRLTAKASRMAIRRRTKSFAAMAPAARPRRRATHIAGGPMRDARSEERRVGKEGRAGRGER